MEINGRHVEHALGTLDWYGLKDNKSMNTPVTFTTESAKLDRLEAIARTAGCNCDVILNDALDSYLEFYDWQSERIRRARGREETSRTYSTEEVRTMMAEYHERRKAEK